MPTKTTDLFEVEHIKHVADRSVDEVASVLKEATGDVTDGDADVKEVLRRRLWREYS
jgi:hypothetical protein